MSGVAAPQYPVTEPFGALAVNPADITLPIPVPTQVGILVGAASFEDGFPAATRTDPGAGGVPPYGQDMNGILYMLSQYAALVQAGQLAPFDAAAAAAFGGYQLGAKVASVGVPGVIWTNVVDGNTNDPDVNPAGWFANVPLVWNRAPAAGTFNDIVIPGASDFAVDVDTAAGNVVDTGFVAQRNGQRLFITNRNVNLYTFDALTGSAANNQLRSIPGGISLVQNQTASFQWIATINKWLNV